MTQFTWDFPELNVVFDEDGMQNVINNVNWRLVATDGSYTAYVYGSVRLMPPSPEAFIPYQNVTKEEVQQWVTDALGQELITEYEVKLQAQIDQEKNPTTGPLPPPWVA